MYHHGLIAPVIALVCWTLAVMIWLGYERVRNINRLKLSPDAGKFARDLNALMPDRAKQVSDNYMHLMEQPTIFYATALALAVMGEGGSLAVNLAWGYAGLRIVHSLVQILSNRVVVRFLVFALASLCLLGLVLLALSIASAQA